jgi:hypothetical protein
MAVVRPEWMTSENAGPAKSGPEQYAPPDRRRAERSSDDVRIALVHRQDDEIASPRDPVPESLNALIRRIAGNSMEEIDRVIRELEGVREILRTEGERIRREIAGYASLNHASMTAMSVIADGIKQWKETPDKLGPSS